MTAKVFTNGRSQAVRLPKEYRFNADEVAINRIGNIVVLTPKENAWDGLLQSLDLFSSDYLSDGRNDSAFQERESL